MKTTVVLPTYNEAENVQLMIPALLDLPLSVCVVDDNSPDGTGALADEWARRTQRVEVMHRAGKLGLGSAYIAGFRRAFHNGADAILTMDADFSHHPRYIPRMLEALGGADLVIGSRYVLSGKVRYPFHRRLLSRTANMVARVTLGLQPQDCTAGFRLYRAHALRSIPLEAVFSNGYSFLIEILVMIQRRGYRVTEVPIIFEDRKYGETKISSREIYKALYTVSRLAARRIAEPRKSQS